MTREIYGIVFDIFVTDGVSRVNGYILGSTVAPDYKKAPIKIEIESGKVIVTFTDKTRHIIPYTDKIEIFDRETEIKNATGTDTANEKAVGRRGSASK